MVHLFSDYDVNDINHVLEDVELEVKDLIAIKIALKYWKAKNIHLTKDGMPRTTRLIEIFDRYEKLEFENKNGRE